MPNNRQVPGGANLRTPPTARSWSICCVPISVLLHLPFLHSAREHPLVEQGKHLNPRHGSDCGIQRVIKGKTCISSFPFHRSKHFSICQQIFRLKRGLLSLLQNADALSSGYMTSVASPCPVGVYIILVPALMIVLQLP